MLLRRAVLPAAEIRGKFGDSGFGDGGALMILVSYIHNNPVRAGLVPTACESDWTSHRAWSGLDDVPAWLGVQQGLRLAGFADTPQGRMDFDRFVAERAAMPREPHWNGESAEQMRTRVRTLTRLPVELGAAVEDDAAEGIGQGIFSPGRLVVAARWEGDLGRLLAHVAQATGVSIDEMCPCSHQPRAVRARRLMLVTGSLLLRRPLKEVAAVLAISASAASRLVRRANELLPEAREIAAALRGTATPEPYGSAT